MDKAPAMAQGASGRGAVANIAIISKDRALAPLPPNWTPQLSDCLQQALEKNLPVRISRAEERAAAQQINLAGARFDPRLAATASKYSNGGTQKENAVVSKTFLTGTEVRAEGGSVFFNNTDRTTGYSTPGTDYGIQIRQPLLRGAGIGVNRAGLEKAHIVAENANATTIAQIFEMLRGTESAYWTASFAGSLEDSQLQGLQRIRRMLGIVKQRKEAGAATKLDILEAEAAVALAEDGVVSADKRRKDSLGQLLYLMGRPPLPPQKSTLLPLEKAATKPFSDPAESYLRAQMKSPVVILLANANRTAKLDLKVAKHGVLPRVDAEYDWGTSSYYGSSGSSTTNQPDTEWAALLRVSIPWTFRAERADLEIARAQLERSETSRVNGLRLLERDIHETCREIAAASQQLEAASRGVAANRAKYEEQRLRYEAGLATVRDVMLAEDELLQAESRHLESRLRLVLANVLLAREEGTILDRHQLTI